MQDHGNDNIDSFCLILQKFSLKAMNCTPSRIIEDCVDCEDHAASDQYETETRFWLLFQISN